MGFQYFLCAAFSCRSHVVIQRHSLLRTFAKYEENKVILRNVSNNVFHMKYTGFKSSLAKSLKFKTFYNCLRQVFSSGDSGIARKIDSRSCFGVLNYTHLQVHNTKRCILNFKNPFGSAYPSRFYCTSPITKDVILFEHDRTRFFRLLAFFVGGQLLFWTSLAHLAFTGLRNTQESRSGVEKVTTGLAGIWSFNMNLGSNTWRYGFTTACLAIGGAVVGLALLFSRRSVSRVVLHKGGKMVTVRTQSPVGVDRACHMTVPLTQVTCHAHRQESPSFIPLRIKGRRFYFLLDKEGTLNNAKLFDVTVGAFRPL